VDPGFPYSESMNGPDDATPEATVRSWWLAWERKDRAALELLAREDYLEFTGHSERHRVGRGTLLRVADRAFELFTISGWEIRDLQQLRPVDDVAFVGYRWRLNVRRGDGEDRLEGVASDILVCDGGGAWRYLSHHSTETGREAGRTKHR
jgi:ketosteroid isomerase-like protein